MTDIFREVEEDVRQEQLTTFLKDHGIKIAAAIVAIIIVYGGVNYWQGAQEDEAAAASDAYNAAVEDLDSGAESAIAKFAAIREDRGMNDYGLLAAFRQAEALASQGKVDDSVAVYDAIADDAGDDFIADLAALYAGSLLIENDKADAGVARLDAIIEDDGPLSPSANEIKAYWLYGNGRQEEARAIFATLQTQVEEGTPIESRVSQMIGLLGSPAEAADE